MTRAFADIAFTDSVKAVQQAHGSRNAYARLEADEDRRDRLEDQEIAFLAERDSFYLASVGERGWPYIQHRGGPKGFLKVLDDRTLGFADFRGNRQYISVGNVQADDRVMLFVMDYATRQRLKIWAQARISEDTKVLAQLELPGYPARIERGVVLTVAALDWNCRQHITRRYTQEEVDEQVAGIVAENVALQTQLAQVLAQRR
jgi:uncharacterized protein